VDGEVKVAGRRLKVKAKKKVVVKKKAVKKKKK
jgi:hypothetical protein